MLGDLVRQHDARGVVVRARGEDDDRDHQTENINCQAAPAAWDFSCRVPAGGAGGHPDGRVQALGVEHHQARVSLVPPALANLPAQQVVDGLAGAVIAPLAEVVLHRADRGQVGSASLRQRPPGRL